MKSTPLREVIVAEANKRGIDPYAEPFRAKTLGIKATSYGSFSDHCVLGETKSSYYNADECLTVAELRKDGKPFKYLLKQVSR